MLNDLDVDTHVGMNDHINIKVKLFINNIKEKCFHLDVFF